jgi:hypothetical protein
MKVTIPLEAGIGRQRNQDNSILMNIMSKADPDKFQQVRRLLLDLTE